MRKIGTMATGALLVGATMMLIVVSGSAGGAPKPKPSPTPTPTSPPPTTPPPAGGFDAERIWSTTNDDWESVVAADPSSNFVYQLTTRIDGASACGTCPVSPIMFRASSDSGVTWGATTHICVCTGHNSWQADPQIAVTNTGVVYAFWMNGYKPGVQFSKSSNRGATWSTPINIRPDGQGAWDDFPHIGISPDGRDIYAAINSGQEYVSYSHDFGATWTTVQASPAGGNFYWFGEGVAVAPNGNVYVAGAQNNSSSSNPGNIFVLRSTNGGATWSSQIVDSTQSAPPCPSAGCSTGFLAAQADIDVDASGKLALLYAKNTANGAPKSLFLRTSTDGTTWSAPISVNTLGDSNFPQIVAGPGSNDFRVAWQDDRNGSTVAYNTYYKRTTDGGSSWSVDVDISNVNSGAPYKSAAGYAFPYGDYFGIDVDSTGRNHVLWSESVSYNGPGGAWYTRG
ncbi:MAG: sialidase family protein [Actinomycetota bacterium]